MEEEARVAWAPELDFNEARQARAEWGADGRADCAGQAGGLTGRQDVHHARVKGRGLGDRQHDFGRVSEGPVDDRPRDEAGMTEGRQRSLEDHADSGTKACPWSALRAGTRAMGTPESGPSTTSAEEAGRSRHEAKCRRTDSR